MSKLPGFLLAAAGALGAASALAQNGPLSAGGASAAHAPGTPLTSLGPQRDRIAADSDTGNATTVMGSRGREDDRQLAPGDRLDRFYPIEEREPRIFDPEQRLASPDRGGRIRHGGTARRPRSRRSTF